MCVCGLFFFAFVCKVRKLGEKEAALRPVTSFAPSIFGSPHRILVLSLKRHSA